MKNRLVAVQIRAVLPASGGFAVVVGNDEKNFVIYVDQQVGTAIYLSISKTRTPRPLTHDLIGNILRGLDVRVEKVVINDLRDNTFFARLFLRDESAGEKRIIEIDARPSDCIAIAQQFNVPILVAGHVFKTVNDVSNLLKGKQPGEET